MTEKLTRICLPGASGAAGFMDWGECSAEHMIACIRRQAADMRAKAEIIEAAADDDFAIDVVRGVHVQHHVRSIQRGRARDRDAALRKAEGFEAEGQQPGPEGDRPNTAANLSKRPS